MPRRSNFFQDLIFLLQDRTAAGVTVTPSALVTDPVTGEAREVDVLITGQLNGYDISVGIEVIDKQRRADVQWVEQQCAKHKQLRTNKLILVSRAGFTKAALKQADFAGVECLSLSEALSIDWELAIGLTSTGTFLLTSYAYTCTALVRHNGGEDQELSIPLDSELISQDQRVKVDLIIHQLMKYPEAKKVLDERARTHSNDELSLEYVHPGKWEIEVPEGILPLDRLTIALAARTTQTPVRFCIGRIGKTEFVAGYADDPKRRLTFVFPKEGPGQLLDGQTVRQLNRSDTSGRQP